MIRNILLLSLAGLALSAPASKVTTSLQSTLSTKGHADIVISFEDTRPTVARVESLRFASRGAKVTFLKEQLQTLQQRSQKAAFSVLSEKKVAFTSLWITNSIYIQGATPEVISNVANIPEIVEIREQTVSFVDEPITPDATTLAEWNIERIEAPQAWALPGGNNGQGTVVSIIDTGVRGSHEALRNNKRSTHSWFDPYDGSDEPLDGNGHGTHVMGTLCGAGGIGVAPGAQWIACRGCNTNACSEQALSACGQFITCPTNPDGTGENCDLAPDLVSNSWGGGASGSYDQVIRAWRAADIVPIFANGNSGPSCGSVSYPGSHSDVIAVTSTDAEDRVSSFSGRGPVGDRIKPDISAPGSNIRSAWHTSDTAYQVISGTSMATPHVAGAGALLLSSDPSLDYDQLFKLLGDHADRDLEPVSACGGTNDWPNNIYGHGRLNARKSLEAAINGL